MLLIKDIQFLIKNNIWISVGLLASGIILLKFSDSPDLIKLIRLLLPSVSGNFIENILTIIGLISLGLSFYTFAVWIKAANEKRNAQRTNAFRGIAQSWGWNYSEHLPSSLRSHIENFLVNRALGIPPHLHGSSQSTANFLSTESDGDLIVIFDCIVSAVNNQGDASTSSETVYLVISDKLDLPYFQTQPETWLGDNVVSGYLKKQAGVNDLEFPQRPEFSKKYVVDTKPANASQIFTPPVFDFYEQNQLYRTIGDGKMLAVINWQTVPVEHNQLSINLQNLRQLYQLLKAD